MTKPALMLLLCLALAGCFKSSEERAAEHFDSAMELVAAGDVDRAMVEFRNVLKYSENDIEARRQMGRIHVSQNRNRQAYRSFLAVVEQSPDDLEGRTTLSELAFRIGNLQEFERHAAPAIALAAEADDEDYRTRAQVLDLALQYREAEANEDRPALTALISQAEAVQQTGFDNDILRRLLISGYVTETRYAEAIEQLDRAIEADPDTIENYGARLDLLTRLGDQDGIDAELRRMVAQFPDDENVKATFLRYLAARGQLDEAETFLRDEIARVDADSKIDATTTLVTFILRLRGAEAAIAELDKAMADAPNAQLGMMRASLQFDTGQQQEAIGQIESILSAEESGLSEDDRNDGRILLARMLETTGNEVGARQLIEEVLAADPTEPNALKTRARWLTQEDNTEGAINALRTAIDSAPEDAEAMTLMAQAYQRAGNSDLMLNFLALAVEATNNAPEESLRYARALIDDGKELQAESILISSLRITPGDIDVLSLLGQIYLRVEDYNRTRQVIDTLRNIDSEQARGNAEALNIDLVAREQGSGQALGLLEDLAASDASASEQAKLGVIRARIASGDTEGALSYAQELVAQAPGDIRFRYALALTNATLRNFEVAETQLTELVADAPEAIGAWLQLIRLQTFRAAPQEAEATLDRALSQNPQAPDLLWAKASLLQNQGDIDGAIAIFDQMYETNSESLIVANNLASLITTFRATPENIERASRIVRRLTDTTVPAFQDTFGWVQHLNGDHETALRYLEPAAQALSQDPAVQIHLGMVYAALDRPEDALAQLKRALAIEGTTADKAELLERARAKIAELEAAPAASD
ncbi:MAG: tetratricopeptide repeat protein [Pseudomonadota bacterium]